MRQKLKQKWSDLRLAGKMALVYLLLLFAALVAALAALQVSFSIYDGQLYEKSLQELDFFRQRVNDSLRSVENFSYELATSVEIQSQLAEMKAIPAGTAAYSYQLYRLRSLLTTEIHTHPIVKNVRYTDGQKSAITVGEAVGEVGGAAWEALLQEMHAARGAYVTHDPAGDYPYQLSGRDILKFSDSSLDYLGSCVITCDVRGMIDAEISALSAADPALCVYNRAGTVLYERGLPEDTLPALAGVQGFRVVHMRGQRYFLCWITDAGRGWTYVNLFPYGEIYGKSVAVRYAMVAVFAGIFALSALLMRRVAQGITSPLQHFTEAMQVVETGDFQKALAILPTHTAKDETGQLIQEFRLMLEQIDTLIHENYEKQLLLQETRYKMLQAQINPHFLNNSLNSVAWLIKAGRNDDAARIVVELGQLLRAALSKEPYTTAAQEAALVQSYIAIQKLRYKNRAEFQLKTEGDLERWQVPRMILQPLAENAILHGVDNSLTPCVVSVTVREEADCLYMSVEDTGPGMDGERLKAVRSFTAAPKGHGIGLKNISERLATAFPGYEMTIDSAPGAGTSVVLRIPKRKAGESLV